MHRLGYLYADGVLTSRRCVVLLGAGLAATAGLVLWRYDAAMVGVEDGRTGNMHPPTLAITTLGLAQIGGAMLLRERLRPWLERDRVWRSVVLVNLSVITVYLWHQGALVVAARLALSLGYPHPTAGTAGWWVAHIAWLLLPGTVLAVIVALVGQAERVAPPTPSTSGAVAATAAATSVVLLGLGLLALAGSSALEPLATGASLSGLSASPAVGVPAVVGAALAFRLLRGGPGAGARALMVAVVTLLLVLALAAALPA